MKEFAIRARGLGVQYDLRLTRHRTLRQAAGQMIRRNGRRRSKFWALEEVTFDVEVGEVLGIIGANAAGKSTLLLTISGIVRPDIGAVETYGRSSTLLARRGGFEAELSGRDNVFLNAAYLGVSRATTAKRLEEIVEFSELGDFINAPLRTYSAGMRARLAFAIAVHVDPEILLLDEVLGVGDEAFLPRSKDKIRELVERAGAVLVVTHNMPFIRDVCTQVLWLDQGRVAAMGNTEETVEAYLASIRGRRGPLRSISGDRSPRKQVDGV